MKEIFIYPIVITIFTYILGYGLAAYLTPKKIASLSWWLSPWYTIVILSVGLTILSLVGITVAQSAIPMTVLLLGLSAKAWFWDRIRNKVRWRDAVLAAVVGVSIFVNLAPLWRNDKILTTVSLGNNDAIIYATVPEYLQKNTIFSRLLADNHEGEYDYNGISNLIRIGYRWGSPITIAYFLEVTGLRGYQLAYLFQVLLFAWMLPLTYVILTIIREKESRLGLFLVTSLVAANANLLYMLYHNFGGQVFFWGLEMLFWIHVFSKKSRKTDWIIGAVVAAVFYSYHEGAVFLLAPFGLWLLIGRSWQAIWRIATATLLLGAVAVIHSLVFDFQQVQLISGSIGWDLFRAVSPFANPVEMLGLWNIHASPPLPEGIAIVLSVVILGITGMGLWITRERKLGLAMLGFYLLMIVWTTLVHNNFFAYNRVITYILPLLIVWFVNGWLRLSDRVYWLGLGMGGLLILASLASGFKLIQRFTYIHISVDRSLMSLTELAVNPSISEPIYQSEVVEGMGYYWRQIWSEYFLYPQKVIVSSANLKKFYEGIVPEDALILVSKESWYNPPKFLFEQKVWENGFFELGRLCLSEKCLLANADLLQKIEFGKTLYDDSMLLSGWSSPENGHRWASGKTANVLWIVDKPNSKIKLDMMATSFINGQTMEVYLNDKLCGKVSLSREWGNYQIPLPTVMPGKYEVSLRFAQVAKPDIAPGDTRDLAADFRRIAFEDQ